MKISTKVSLAALGALLWCAPTNAQTINIGPNQYAFQYTIDPDFGLFFNSTNVRYEFRNGSAAPIFAFSANNGAMSTNLTFGNGADLLIGNNRYAFRASSNPNYGLFFNSSTLQYQFLNSAAAPVFAINAGTGEYASDIEFEAGSGVLVKPNTFGLRSAVSPLAGLYFGGPEYEFRDLAGSAILALNVNGNARVAGGMKIGNSTANQAGNIRWTGSDFQGYNGSTWASLTAESGWGLTGNAGTIAGTNFIGTIDNVPLSFRFNNLPSGRLDGISTSFGLNALSSLTTGIDNTAFGISALQSNTIGIRNTAIGRDALQFNTSGSSSTAIGHRSLKSNTVGVENTATGYEALEFNINGIRNTANGAVSLRLNTSGSNNTAMGAISLLSNTIGSENTANGTLALLSNTTGNRNTSIGFQALNVNTTGSDNTAIGANANVASGALTNATAIGANAIVNASNRMVLGAPGTAIQFNGELRPNNLPGTAGQVLTSQGPGTAPTWGNAGGSGWGLTGNAGTNPATNFLGTTDAQPLRFATGAGGVERMRILATGNVGIGTVTPGAKLNIHEPNILITSPTVLTLTGASTGGGSIGMGFSSTNGSAEANIASITLKNTVATDKSLQFHNSNPNAIPTTRIFRFLNNTTAPVLTMLNSGNVGIGTEDPVAKLDVNFNQPDATNNRAINVLMNGFSDNTTNSIGIRSQLTGNGSLSNVAVEGTVSGASAALNGSNIGGRFISESAFDNAFGIRSTASDGGLVRNYGVYGESFGTTGIFNGGGMFFGLANGNGVGSDFNVYGVYGFAENIGAGPAYSVYGDASATTDFAGFFNGNVEVIGVFNNPSDERLKTNINPLTNSLDKLKSLNVYTYNFDAKGAYSSLNLPSGMQYGFMAQEIETVFPELVRENRVPAKGMAEGETVEISNATYKSVNNMGLIPVLTKAIQEQQKTIEEQHESIEALIGSVGDLVQENSELRSVLSKALLRIDFVEQDLQTCCFNSESGSNAGTNNNPSEAAGLGQNIPNPFSESTIIRYYLPEGSVNAIIRITNMEGKPIKDLRLGDQRGANQVEFQTQSLASGTYLYTLFVDGKFIDTKKMMVVR